VALIGLVLGALIGLGLVQLLGGGGVALPRPRRLPSGGVMLGGCVAVGLTLWTRWPVLGIAGGVLAAQMLKSRAEAATERRTLERRAELARIAGRLRDACLAGHGLPAAVSIAAASAGPETHSDLAALARAVREVGVGRAFAAFAERADDPIFAVFARMVREADRQGSDTLSSLLSRLATQTAKEVAAARETAARHNGPRAVAPVAAVFAVALLLGVRFGSPAYAAAYSDAAGQLMMAAAFVPLAVGCAAIARLGRALRDLSWGAG
jgi:Flp pilus assembly protein TadB